MAQAKSNFSGAWNLNTTTSDFGPLPNHPQKMLMTVEQAEPAIQMTQDITGAQGNFTARFKYTTDGKKTTFESQGAHVASSAVWDGSVLVVVSDVSEIGAQFTDRMALSDDGKTLISSVHVTSAQGDLDMKVVFDRQ